MSHQDRREPLPKGYQFGDARGLSAMTPPLTGPGADYRAHSSERVIWLSKDETDRAVVTVEPDDFDMGDGLPWWEVVDGKLVRRTKR